MDIAEQIVVMNNGAIEQTGTATDLYDSPANEFVMGFVGEVNQIGGKLVRPHDLEILPVAAEGTIEARVERIVTLGFSGRVELLIEGDHREAWAQLTRHEIDDLNLAEEQLVYIRPRPDAVTKEDTGVVEKVGLTEDPPASDRPTAAGSGLPV